MELKQYYAAIIYADSNRAIDQSGNSQVSQSAKHIDIHCHYVKEHVDKIFKLEYILTKENLVDLLTKILTKLNECLTRNIMMP
jgi:DNA-binding MarR family transcriptional regulator